MSDNVKTKDDQIVTSFLADTQRMIKEVQALRKKSRPFLGGHRYLNDDELSKRLNINRRTLQDYRNAGRIPFVKLGGKILYRESDIEKVLQDNYRK